MLAGDAARALALGAELVVRRHQGGVGCTEVGQAGVAGIEVRAGAGLGRPLVLDVSLDLGKFDVCVPGRSCRCHVASIATVLAGCQDVRYSCFVSNCDPVGISEIATRLNVKRETVDIWRFRHLLPEPSWTVGGRPAWNWPDVETWAKQSGRLPS